MADSAESLYARGNEAFVDEKYDDAAKYYTEAIEKNPDNPDYFLKRSHAYLKLKKYAEVKHDAEMVLRLGEKNAKAFLRKGIACYYLKEYEEAQAAFKEGASLDETMNIQEWLDKCKVELEKVKAEEQQKNTGDATTTANTSTSSSSPQIVTKRRYDWYQTDTHVVITLLLKNVKPENLRVSLTENTLSCTVKQPSGSDFSLELDLAHPIVVPQCKWKILPSKIEIKLMKAEGLRWEALEQDDSIVANVKHIPSDSKTGSESAPKYPSSSRHQKDWDKIVEDIKKEEAEEKEEGEAALNQLFHKIYSQGSDEVKKAMNKSFLESGGTVLSTNWKDVAEKKIEVKPPEGMEWRKWD